jgi:ubiquinone/menaquinone biosynthesis C-methylase UbiE
MESDPTKRFSDRVDNYVKYRPGYPPKVLEYLKDKCNLLNQSIIADVGAGTGIFTKLLLEADYQVYAVEPNEAMRNASVEQLSAYKKFKAINGKAESTTLSGQSIDLIVCAQAFHWFSNEATRVEFNRILKDNGKTALIWNNRITDADDFATAYNALLKNDSVDYNKVNHQNISDINFKAFFKDGKYVLKKFPNVQVFDLDGLTGRAFSSSYVPPQDTDKGKVFLKLLKELFNKYNSNGHVSFHYQTEIYWGQV